MGLKEKDTNGCPRSSATCFRKKAAELAAGTPVVRFSRTPKVLLKTYGWPLSTL